MRLPNFLIADLGLAWRLGFIARKRQEQRKSAALGWMLRSNLMAYHFDQDFDVLYGWRAEAIAAPSHGGSLDYGRALLSE